MVLFSAQALVSQDAAATGKKKATSIRFHSGTLLAAELMPENSSFPVEVKNVSPNEPPSRITSDVGYVTLTVRLDPGRSLSIYDYVLVSKRKDEFKCIGIREAGADYDYEKWEIPVISQDKLYNLLFRVQMPAFNEKHEYILKFALSRNNPDQVIVPLSKIGGPFSPPESIPKEGAIGADSANTDTAKIEVKPNEVRKPDDAKPAEAKVDVKVDAKEGFKTKSSKWCSFIFPDKISVGQTMDVKVLLKGLKGATKLCAELHCRTTGRVYAGIYATAEPQAVTADGEYSFKFDIKDKENLESLNLFIYLSPTGSSNDQKESDTGPDIPVSGATKVEKPPEPPKVAELEKKETKQPEKKDKPDAKPVTPRKPGQEVNLMADKSSENYGWTSDNGQEFPGATVKLSVDKKEKNALKLEGNFTNGGAYVQAAYQLKSIDFSEIDFDLKYPDHSTLCLRVGDSSGQCHQINIKIKETSDWQKFSLKGSDIESKNPQVITKYETWGGSADSKWHGPATFIAFIIGAPSGKPEKTAVLWLNNVKIK